MAKSISVFLLLALLVGLGSTHYHPAPDPNLHYHQVPSPPASESGNLLLLLTLLGIYGAAIIVGMMMGAITGYYKDSKSTGRFSPRVLPSRRVSLIAQPGLIPCNARHDSSVACTDSSCPIRWQHKGSWFGAQSSTCWPFLSTITIFKIMALLEDQNDKILSCKFWYVENIAWKWSSELSLQIRFYKVNSIYISAEPPQGIKRCDQNETCTLRNSSAPTPIRDCKEVLGRKRT